jgi:hypothetical protein
MRFDPLLLAPLLVASVAMAATPAVAGERGESPVVVELYTSQGCSGCLEASGYAGELAGREGVLLLSFGVDYWDYLGWRDTFARTEFVERQRDYTARLDNRHPYTPQMVVDGHVNGPGFNRDFVDVAISFCHEHLAESPPVTLERRDGALSVEIGDGERPDAAADVWLVAFEPGVHEVAINAGENADAVMRTYNVVRSIEHLGAWSGDAMRLATPASDALSYAVLVQRPALGGMLAAAAETGR